MSTTTIVRTQQGKWDGYGWALRVLYLEAKKEPEIFLVALKTFRGDPTLEPLREKLHGLIHAQATGFFQPAARRAGRRAGPRRAAPHSR